MTPDLQPQPQPQGTTIVRIDIFKPLLCVILGYVMGAAPLYYISWEKSNDIANKPVPIATVKDFLGQQTD